MALESGARAAARFVWLSPFKVRRLANRVRYRSVTDAVGILQHISHRSAEHLSKVIRSATANFLQTNQSSSEKDIVITQLLVDEGPRIKRLWQRARGRADVLLKRMCHITVRVDLLSNISDKKKSGAIRPALKSATVAPSRTPRAVLPDSNTTPLNPTALPDSVSDASATDADPSVASPSSTGANDIVQGENSTAPHQLDTTGNRDAVRGKQ